MFNKPRSKEFEDKVFTDEKGVKYQGQRFIVQPQEERDIMVDRSYPAIEVWYLDGKLHGNPAIRYPDGLSEEWDNGKYVKTMDLPYHLRK